MGLLLAVVVGDRSRGRRRCPKCWHSLKGLPEQEMGGWICPECGKIARRKKDMFRSRRGTPVKLALLVFVLLAGGAYGKGVWNRWGEGHPRRWTPTLPAVLLVARAPDSLPSAIAAVNSGLEGMLASRVRTGWMPDWQQDLLAWRMLDDSSEAVWALVEVPPVWLKGEPIPITVRPPDLGAGMFTESLHVTGRSPGFSASRRSNITRFLHAINSNQTYYLPGYSRPGMSGSSWYVEPSYLQAVHDDEVVITLFAEVDVEWTAPSSFASHVGLSWNPRGLSGSSTSAAGVGQQAVPAVSGLRTYQNTKRLSRTFTIRLVDDIDEMPDTSSLATQDPAFDAFLAAQPFWEAWFLSERYYLRPVSPEPIDPPDVYFPVDVELRYQGFVICRISRELRSNISSRSRYRSASIRSGISFNSSTAPVDERTAMFPKIDTFPSVAGLLADEADAEVLAWKAVRDSVGDFDGLMPGFTVRYSPNPDIPSFGSRVRPYWIPADGSPYMEVPLTDVIRYNRRP